MVSASSGSLSAFEHIKFYLNDNKLLMRDISGNAREILAMHNLKIPTVHCLAGKHAAYTQLNSYNSAVIGEFTQAIIRGEVNIVGSYSCVNNLGIPPLPNAVKITPAVPVPIKIRHGDEYYINIEAVKVKRGSASWYMYRGHVEGITTEGDGRGRMQTGRVYMCGNSDSQHVKGVWNQEDADEFGSLSALPADLVHSDERLDEVTDQDFNNLTDIHLKQIVVKDTTGCAGMVPVFASSQHDFELWFYVRNPVVSARIYWGARYMDENVRPYICSCNGGGLPDIVVFSEQKVKRSYRVVKALVTNPTLLFHDYRLNEALSRYLRTFPETDLKQISRAFGSNPLAFVTRISRLCVEKTFLVGPLFKGHLSHTCLSSSTNSNAIHVPAYSRHELEGYTLANMGRKTLVWFTDAKLVTPIAIAAQRIM